MQELAYKIPEHLTINSCELIKAGFAIPLSHAFGLVKLCRQFRNEVPRVSWNSFTMAIKDHLEFLTSTGKGLTISKQIFSPATPQRVLLP